MMLRRGLSLALVALAAPGCGGQKKIPNTLPPTSTDSAGCVALAKTPTPSERHAPKPTKRLDASKTYDPTGTGTSGPGYSTVDPVPRGTKYTLGVAAMAKTAAEKTGTAGSQFFIVTTKDARLPPDYAVLGKVVDGLDNVERIGQLGDGQTGSPTRLVEIKRAMLDVH